MVKQKPLDKISKAIIIQIGTVDKNNQPQDWIFDCLDIVPAFEIKTDGKILYGGWSVDELRTMAARSFGKGEGDVQTD